MGAEIIKNDKGQSMIELMVLLPVVIGTLSFLIKTNSAIQVSINNQQYARAQILIYMSNSSNYPRVQDISSWEAEGGGINRSKMVFGVSDNIFSSDADIEPEAVISPIVTKDAEQGSRDTGTEDVKVRGKIRVRTTVALCAPLHFVANGKLTRENLGDNHRFNYCQGGIDE
ncbi:MAG: hypothetical protein CL678_10110 [Bdellovibrionaceae bacterium]|nr:hypothetical protein [Pseudobdellovibrionaceae bacterium]|tara:strand:- start:2015 stop:2527 length:513 start_codon:yes stop_codon:yes gene_type:complete